MAVKLQCDLFPAVAEELPLSRALEGILGHVSYQHFTLNTLSGHDSRAIN